MSMPVSALQENEAVRDIWQRIAAATQQGITLYSEERASFEFYSYSDLLAYAAAAAVALEGLGIQRQDKVLITAHTTPSFLMNWLGLMLLGATPVPLPPKKTLTGEGAFKQRIQQLLKHHRFCLCGAEDRPDIEESVQEQMPVSIFLMEDVTRELELETGRKLLERLLNPGSHSRRMLQWDDEAFIQYTSGSTGHPKGAVITLRNLMANVRAIDDTLKLNPAEDVFVSWLPLYHDMGLVGMFLNCTFNTTSLVLVPTAFFAKRPLRFLTLLGQFRASHCVMPNFALEWILRTLAGSRRQEHFQLESVKWFGVGSEPISPETLRHFQRAMAPHGLRPTALSPSYGMAETTLAVSLSRPGVPYALCSYQGQEVPCVGPLVRGFEVKIEPMDGHAGAGKIKLRGESVSRWAYVGGEKIERLDRDGFHDSQDIGFLHDGELVILGRADEVFIVNGVNYFPYDLEMVVRAMPELGARRVACFGVTQPPSTHSRLVMLYEVQDASVATRQLNEERIRQEILSRFGLRLDEIIAVPPKAIPVTTSGKIQRKQARALYQTGAFETRRDAQ